MDQISLAALCSNTVVSTMRDDIRFRTMQTFTEFHDYMKANYPPATFEFINDLGEKVILVQDNYIEFLKSSDGYSNYVYSNLQSHEKIQHPPNLLEKWKCNFCNFIGNTPDRVNCKVCGTPRPN